MDYVSMILVAAKTVKVPGALLLAICMHETGLKNTMVPIDGKSPTFGVCQIKLPTAQMIGYKGTANGLMKPQTNALWAAKYLKWQLNRYTNNWCMAVASYNSGSYNESQVMPGYPRNFKYVLHVQSKLPLGLRKNFACGEMVAQK